MAEPDIGVDSPRRSTELAAVGILLAVFFVVSLIRHNPFSLSGDGLARGLGTIVAAGLTLVMFSFLYRDNPLFKAAENLYVGVALGYTAIQVWRMALREEVFNPIFMAPTREALLEALIHRSVPIILGVMLLTRVSRKHGWISRYSYCPLVGWGAGLGISVVTHSFVLRQLHAAIAPLQKAVTQGSASPLTGEWFLGAFFPVIGSLAMLIGTVAVLFYFFFSIEHKGVGGAVSRVGVWFLMIAFGASFGYTVMARMSLLIGRVQFLLFEWLKVPQ